MSWSIVVDSSCNLRAYTPETPCCSYRVVPLKIHVGDRDFVDDGSLDVHELNEAVQTEECASSSSCPSVGEWAEAFEGSDCVIALTISSNLSGSYEAACIARDMIVEKEPGRQIAVFDSKSAGGQVELLVTLLDGYLKNDPSLEEAIEYLDGLRKRSQVLFSLSDYANLTKAGRMPKMAGAIANKLNIRMLGCASDEGTIKIVGPTRGEKKMHAKIVDTMRADGFGGGLVYIDHVENERAAAALKDLILASWPQSDVRIVACGGLCSYYAERDGLIIGYSW